MNESAFWVVNWVATMVTAAGVIALVIPRVVLLSYRRHLFDVPGGRKIHRDRVSRLGGLVFFPVMVFAVLLVLAVNMLAGSTLLADVLLALPRQGVCAMCGMLLLYFTGLRDDLSALSPWPKLAVQVAAGALLAFSGCRLRFLSGFVGLDGMGDVPAIFVTVCAAVLIINAINFIDGIDGLASVVCGLCFVWQGAMGMAVGDYGIVLPAMAGVGVAGSFLFFNFNGIRGKRVFMGDTGSLTFGFLATWLAIRLDGGGVPDSFPVSPFVMSVTPLVVPCADALRVVAARLLHGRNPLRADTSHLHHILYRRGLPAVCIVLALGALSAAVMVLNIILSYVSSTNVIILADTGLFFLFFVVSGRVRVCIRR